MPERQIVVRPLGLITQPNKLGQIPDGALARAVDVVMRSPGILTSAYTKSAFGVSFRRPRLLHSTANQLLAIVRDPSGSTFAEWNALNLGGLPTNADVFSTTGRLQAITMRGRTIVNTKTRESFVADYENPSTTAERAFRSIGMLQPRIFLISSTTTNGQAVADGTIVTYGAIIKREYSDGYIVKSRPSVFVRFFAGSGGPGTSANTTWRVTYEFVNAPYVQAGDIVELYRSQSIPSNGTADDDPGGTLYLAVRRTITSTDVANGFIDITDSTLSSAAGGPLGGLGEALYTNPDFGGLAAGHDPPPTAACIASFRGRAWYANCIIPPEFSWAYRRGLGELTTATQRANGVGRRAFTGTFTNGSPNVTGISAAEMVGLAVGQQLSGGSPAFGAQIQSVGVNSITMTGNAGASGSFNVAAQDVLEIDGTPYPVMNLITQGFSAVYVVTTSRSLYDKYQSVVDFKLRKLSSLTNLTIRATNGDKYEPNIPSMSQTALSIAPKTLKNYVRYSEDQQPEAVPGTNEAWVGSGEIYAQIPTRDAEWYFCGDGLHRLSGTIGPIQGVPDIRVDPIDSTLILAGPRAWCVLRDRIYAYTNRGLIAIADDSIIELTTGVIGDLLPGAMWNEAETPFLVADERTDEIYIIGAHATLNFVYSVRYGAFTTTSQFDGAQTGVQLATSLALVFGYTTTTLDQLQPDLTALMSTGSVDFQPVFGGRPDLQKQWIDVTFIMTPGTSDFVTPRFSGIPVVFREVLNSAGGFDDLDQRVTFGVPRDAPAIAPSIQVGCEANGFAMRLESVSLRYVTTTEQGGTR